MALVASGAPPSGTYRTAVGNPPPGEALDLAGFVGGDPIAFTVNFEAHGCVVA